MKNEVAELNDAVEALSVAVSFIALTGDRRQAEALLSLSMRLASRYHEGSRARQALDLLRSQIAHSLETTVLEMEDVPATRWMWQELTQVLTAPPGLTSWK